jgi:predicted ATPase
VEGALGYGRQSEQNFRDAELLRLKGRIFRRIPDHDDEEAEALFCQAIKIAQGQEAKSLELRAATSLARLWHSQGKRAEARELLQPVYDWFTEGFDTTDLREARALQEELA